MNNLILSLFALLIFVLSIPGTMALRNVLAVFLLISLLFIWYKNKKNTRSLSEKGFKNIVFILLFISIYILIHSMYFSHEPSWSLGEFKSHWLYPMLYFIMGILLASISQNKKYFNKETLITFLFYGLFLHILYIDLSALEDFIRSDIIVRRYGGLSVSVATASYLTNILFALTASEILYRFLKKDRVIKVSNIGLAAVFLLCILSAMIEASRFGIILSILILFIAILLFIKKSEVSRALKLAYPIFFISLISIPLIYSLNTDPRWSLIGDTIEIVLEGGNSKHWLDPEAGPLRVPSGEPVSSGYLRMAWFITGIEYILKDPVGIGYGRNSFGHAIEINENNSNFRGGHSHGSIIDFTIGTGIVGIIAWMFFIFKVFQYASIKYNKSCSYYSILTLLIVSDFFIRSFVDSNMRDHMFQEFMLILGISLALSAYEEKRKLSSV